MKREEIWKDIPNYEGFYQASNFGNIKSLQRFRKNKGNYLCLVNERILKPAITSSGYFSVVLNKDAIGKTNLIHQIVANVFLNHTCDGYNVVVDHIDNDKLNNAHSNLQLISARKNTSKDSKNKTGFLGVYKSGNKFISQIRIKEKHKHLGTFKTPELASKAYQDKLEELKNVNI